MITKQEQKLLLLLQNNARTSVSDLARALNLSRTTVQNRIAKLEHQGVIKSYSVELGADYLSELINAHVLIKINQPLTHTINTELEKLPQVVELHAISGEYDLIAVVKSETLTVLNQTLDFIAELEGVERTNSSVILETKLRR